MSGVDNVVKEDLGFRFKTLPDIQRIAVSHHFFP